MPTINELLASVSSDVHKTVRETIDRARPIIREAMRAECRLSMNAGADDADERAVRAQVPIKISSAMPDGLASLTISDDAAQLLALAPMAATLQAMDAGMPSLIRFNQGLRVRPGKRIKAIENAAALDSVRAWASELWSALRDENPVKVVLNVDRDTLGLYSYDAHEDDETVANAASILLYWMPIGLVANAACVKVEDLTVVVLTHELAHAYTQLGADIEGRRWPSAAYERAATALKEALAQYYTERCLARMRQRFPLAEQAFERLVELQPKVYSEHEEFSGTVSPEAVRWAMLEVRRYPAATLDDFKSRLVVAAKRYPARPAREVAGRWEEGL